MIFYYFIGINTSKIVKILWQFVALFIIIIIIIIIIILLLLLLLSKQVQQRQAVRNQSTVYQVPFKKKKN